MDKELHIIFTSQQTIYEIKSPEDIQFYNRGQHWYWYWWYKLTKHPKLNYKAEKINKTLQGLANYTASLKALS